MEWWVLFISFSGGIWLPSLLETEKPFSTRRFVDTQCDCRCSSWSSTMGTEQLRVLAYSSLRSFNFPITSKVTDGFVFCHRQFSCFVRWESVLCSLLNWGVHPRENKNVKAMFVGRLAHSFLLYTLYFLEGICLSLILESKSLNVPSTVWLLWLYALDLAIRLLWISL